MQSLSEMVTGTLRGLSRLLLLAGLAVFVLGALLLGLVLALGSVLWSLLRGRRPVLFTVFATIRQATRFARSNWAAPAARATPAADVVDVEAVDVPDLQPRPLIQRAATPTRSE